MSKDHVKVLFRLVQDADGHPPVAVESVWATKATPEGYTLDNIPFFASAATLGDTVKTLEDDDGAWFSKLLIPSANSLVRVVLFEPERVSELRQHLAEIGCATEWDEPHNLVAVNIPRPAILEATREYLLEACKQGWLDYEEAILR